jgi:hypothetical protein
LYAALGYAPVSGYGVYAGMPGAVFLGKRLGGPIGDIRTGDTGAGDEEERPWAS